MRGPCIKYVAFSSFCCSLLVQDRIPALLQHEETLTIDTEAQRQQPTSKVVSVQGIKTEAE